MPKTIPVPDDVSKPFWDAVNERRLVLQFCTGCNKLQYPPAGRCRKCGSEADKLEWSEVQGRGHILETMVVHDTRVVRRKSDVPFNVALISLDEDPDINFLSNLPGTPPHLAPAHAAVELVFEEVAPGQLIHEWRVIG
ncbi:MAG: zinc ribbon domain-containing protein [Chloroflexota bacterium]